MSVPSTHALPLCLEFYPDECVAIVLRPVAVGAPKFTIEWSNAASALGAATDHYYVLYNEAELPIEAGYVFLNITRHAFLLHTVESAGSGLYLEPVGNRPPSFHNYKLSHPNGTPIVPADFEAAGIAFPKVATSLHDIGRTIRNITDARVAKVELIGDEVRLREQLARLPKEQAAQTSAIWLCFYQLPRDVRNVLLSRICEA